MKNYLRDKLLEALLTEKDNRKQILKTFADKGVTEEVANWAHTLHDKLSIWVVDSMLKKYSSDMEGNTEKTPINQYFPELTYDYEQFFELLKETNRPPINAKELSFDEATDLVGKYGYIKQWISNPEYSNIDLREYTWEEAEADAQRWHNGLEPVGKVYDIDSESEIIEASKVMGDGYYWALTRNWSSPKSAKSMGHCGMANNSNRDMWLLHLRKGGEEFVTVDYHPTEKYFAQIKGKQNKKPAEKYHKYLIWLLDNWDVEKLRTNKKGTYSPETNWHLGELPADEAIRIFNEKPGIETEADLIKWAPESNKGKIVAALFKNEKFLLDSIPNKFFNYLSMVEGNGVFPVIGAALKSPNFFKKMNRYKGYLTFTLERFLELVPDNVKDKLIWDENKKGGILGYDGMIDMLDKDGANLLINNYSDPDYIRDMFLDYEVGAISYVDGKLQVTDEDEDDDYDEDDYYDDEPESSEQGPDDEEGSGAGEPDEEEVPVPVSESHKRKARIIKELRNRFGKVL